MRIILRICRKRRLRSADVAKTLPWEPAASTAMDAMSTMMSAETGSSRRLRAGGLPRRGSRRVDRWPEAQAECPAWGRWLVSAQPSPGHSRGAPLCLSVREATWAEHPRVSPGLPAPSRAPVRPAPPRGLTDHTERLSGELETPPPAAVPAAAARGPDAHEVLHSEHHDGHDLLQGAQMSHRRARAAGAWPGSAGSSPKPGTRAPQTCILDPGGPSVPNSNQRSRCGHQGARSCPWGVAVSVSSPAPPVSAQGYPRLRGGGPCGP